MMQSFHICRIATTILFGYLNLAGLQAWFFCEAAGHNYMPICAGNDRYHLLIWMKRHIAYNLFPGTPMRRQLPVIQSAEIYSLASRSLHSGRYCTRCLRLLVRALIVSQHILLTFLKGCFVQYCEMCLVHNLLTSAKWPLPIHTPIMTAMVSEKHHNSSRQSVGNDCLEMLDCWTSSLSPSSVSKVSQSSAWDARLNRWSLLNKLPSILLSKVYFLKMP